MLLEGFLIGGVNVLIGIALFQRSKVAFRIIFILGAYGLLTGLVTLSKQSTNYWPALINGIVFEGAFFAHKTSFLILGL